MPQQKPLSFAPDTSGSSTPPRRSRPWAAVLVVLILAGAAGWFWLGKDPAKRDSVLSSARQAVTDVTDKIIPGAQPGTQGATTPAQPMTPSNGAQPGAPDASQTPQEAQPPANRPETAAEPPVLVAPPADAGTAAAPAGPDAEGKTTRGLISDDPNQPLDPSMTGRKDDAVLSPRFIEDLAEWMVANYVPSPTRGGRGGISGGLQSANARYGVNMKGIAWVGDDLHAGRIEALKYVYTPGMLDALYRMYIDRFMQDMADASLEPRKNGKALEPTQIAEMYRLYAGRFRALSGALQGVAAIENLRARVTRLQEATQKMVAANSHYMEEVFKFDQAREHDDRTALEKTRTAMEAASDVYQTATRERDDLRDALVATIRNNSEARGLGDNNLYFVAMWVDRRLQQSPVALDASLQAATLLLDLAQRFEQTVGLSQ